MSKPIYAAILGLTFAAGVASAPAAFAQAAPHLTVAEPRQDFGTVHKGDKLDWAFNLRNTGSSDLVIKGVSASCNCTAATFTPVIHPGQSGTVVAHVDTASLIGQVAKAVIVETNDPETPTLQLTVVALVKPYVDAYPVGYIRTNLLQGDTEKQSVTLWTDESEPFEIVSIESPVDWIHVDKHKATPAEAVAIGRSGQAQYRLDITVGGPDARLGPIAERIRIRTNSKHQPEYLFNVSGVIRPVYRFDPRSVNFGEVAVTDNAAIRAIMVRSNNLKTPETFVATRASSNLPGLKVELRQAASKGEFEVTLSVTRAMKPGPFEGEVKIETNDPGNPVATVPVRGVVKP